MRYLVLLASLALLVAPPTPTHAEPAETAPASLLELEAKRLGGPSETLSNYRGQVLLVVNTASQCGLTPQYAGLQDLYDLYQERGFSVLGFPSNDFGNQEPGDAREIGAFCRSNYGVEFPMFSKVRVGGKDAHPVYAFLTSRPPPVGGPVQWNFQKYLIDRNGEVVARFAPATGPMDPRIVEAVERLLDQPAPPAQTAWQAR